MSNLNPYRNMGATPDELRATITAQAAQIEALREMCGRAEAAIHDWRLGSVHPDDEEYRFMRASSDYLDVILRSLRLAATGREGVEIVWTAPMLRRFIEAYRGAEREGHDPFVFEGNEFVLRYAYYLIEYLSVKLRVEGSMSYTDEELRAAVMGIGAALSEMLPEDCGFAVVVVRPGPNGQRHYVCTHGDLHTVATALVETAAQIADALKEREAH